MVDPSARRRGIGRALYDRTVLWFRSLGIGVVRLHVAVKSDEARAFWKSLGAKDFLVEAWIDLDHVPAPPPEESPAESRRSGFDYPDDVLAGPEGSR